MQALAGHPVTWQPALLLVQHLGVLSRAGGAAKRPPARLPHTETCSLGKEREDAGVQEVSRRPCKSAEERRMLEN